MNRQWNRVTRAILPAALIGAAFTTGCRSVGGYRADADRAAAGIIATVQSNALGRAEAIEIESPADTLRRRLLLDQELAYGSQASLGIRDLPDSDYWQGAKHLLEAADTNRISKTDRPLTIGLPDALRIGAANSRDFQQAKEDLFRAALDMDLECDEFRNTFSGMLSGRYDRDGSGEETVASSLGSGELGVSRKLLSGVELSSRIAVDLVRLLTQDTASSVGLLADAGISIPLLRGAGRKIAAEPLKQAEQNMLYEVYSFERFKRAFAVRVASDYFGVLRQAQELRNVEENYKRLIAAARRARRLADSGRLPEFQFDQAVQDELRARTRWIEATQNYAARVDGFKLSLGLPTDAGIELDGTELGRLLSVTNRFDAAPESGPRAVTIPPADAEIVLDEPDAAQAGPLELGLEHAVSLALDSRLDLRTAHGKVEDAQRKVYVAADALRAEATLLGQARAGERRSSAGSASDDDAELRFADGTYSGLINLDLPFERTAERNAYRKSLIGLEKAVRDMQELEDQIKLDIRNTLRDLQAARESLVTQIKAVALAAKRVRSTDLFLQAGRAQIRDVLDSQEALLNAQNALTAAIVSYRIAELNLQRDMGVLQVAANGLWKEYTPEEQNP